METFFKYHALGNDFVIIERPQGRDLDEVTTRTLCDRHFGIGADGVLTILPEPGTAGRMVVHNADGSIAEMCGNGLRCVVKHLAEKRVIEKHVIEKHVTEKHLAEEQPAQHPSHRPSSLKVATGAGVLDCQIEWGPSGVDRITVAMGPAHLRAPTLPRGGPFVRQVIEGPAGTLLGTAVSMGNPHLVLLDVPPSEAGRLGPTLEVHPLFPERTNVELFRPRPGGGLEVKVWERGVGLTLACGTGACAAVVASALDGRSPFGEWVPVELPGGLLNIKVAADLSQVWLAGSAHFVFEGRMP